VTETSLKSGKPTSSPLSGLIVSIGYAMVVIAVFAVIALRFQSSERELCRGVAFRAAADVEQYMAGLEDEASVMASTISRTPDMDKSAASRIAAALMASRPYVTGVSVAPSALVRFQFPETEGESMVGHDLLSNPERRDALTKAMELKEPVFSGPFESLEGGSVLFIRYPVFNSGKFWGFVSVTVDFKALVDALALGSSYPGFAFALSAADGLDAAEQAVGEKSEPAEARPSSLMIAGEAGAFKLGVASAFLGLRGLAWRLHIMPARGWLALSPALYLLGVAALAGAFFLFAWLKTSARKQDAAAATQGQLFSLSGSIDSPMDHSPKGSSARSVAETRQAGREAKSSVGKVVTESEEAPAKNPPLAPSDEVTIQFKGPSVKGQLYMPDVMFSGDPKDLFAHLRVVEESGKAGEPAEPKPKPLATTKGETEATVLPPGEKNTTPAPAPAKSANEEETEQKARVNPKTVSILVVDDSEANRDIMGRMLALRGYEPEFAASGEEALARCSAKEFAIIFMDCFMPGMNGYAASKLIRSSKTSARTKIVGMSAKVGDQELERCRASGMNELLSKPFTLSQLTAMIQPQPRGEQAGTIRR
jgi:CheY-like chemotaxis protein